MDVQRTTRERVFSILNDNDCPSFVHRQKQSSPSPPPLRLPSATAQRLPSISTITSGAFQHSLSCPRLERPSLSRQPQFHRNPSVSSVSSPPLLRYDSSSSAKSSSSMDSTPSPITPAYNYNDSTMMSDDGLLRQDPSMNFLPSPTGITPFMDQTLIIGHMPQNAFDMKSGPPLAPAAYPILPVASEMTQIPTPALSTELSSGSTTSINAQSQQTTHNNTLGNNTGKKNKYPCPYAQSHSCSATFTTSGHAARHGKKHTGEKGVHCPVCDKAFTRKDNMKQHERTHKNRPANGEEKKSKAQATREANKTKEAESEEQSTLPEQSLMYQTHPVQTRQLSSGLSEPSDITLAPNPVDTPTISPEFYPDSNPQIVLPSDGMSAADLTPSSMYPPISDELLSATMAPLSTDKLDVPIPQPPALVRGFSDLDTLAQAAESFDPYFQQGQFQ